MSSSPPANEPDMDWKHQLVFQFPFHDGDGDDFVEKVLNVAPGSTGRWATA